MKVPWIVVTFFLPDADVVVLVPQLVSALLVEGHEVPGGAGQVLNTISGGPGINYCFEYNFPLF